MRDFLTLNGLLRSPKRGMVRCLLAPPSNHVASAAAGRELRPTMLQGHVATRETTTFASKPASASATGWA